MPDVYYPNNPFNLPPPVTPFGGVIPEPLPDGCVRDPDRTNPSVSILKRIVGALPWGRGHQLILKSWGKNPEYLSVFIYEQGRASEHPAAFAAFQQTLPRDQRTQEIIYDKVQPAQQTRGLGWSGIAHIIGVLQSKQDRLRRIHNEYHAVVGYKPPSRTAVTRVVVEWPNL
jgi:hypothetical protein